MSPPAPRPDPPLPLAWMVAALVLGLAVGGLALGLWALDLPTLSSSYGRGYQPFELLGFLVGGAALALAIGAARGAWGPPEGRAARVAPLVVTLAVALHATGFISEYSTPSLDWGCYWDAAEAVAAGGSPYGRCYIYPPLLAQLLAGVLRLTAPWGPALGLGPDEAWFPVFFTLQAGQLLAAPLLALVMQRVGRRWGLSPLVAAVVVAGLLLVDNPLLRTLRHNQINLWIAALSLLAVDLLDRRPGVAGGLLAVAVHLKLYPLVLVLPWALGRRWRAVGAALGATALLGVVVTGRHPEQWAELLALGDRVAAGQTFRNNSLLGLVVNLVRVPRLAAGQGIEDLLPALRLAGLALSALAGALVLLRMLRRHRAAGPPAARLHADTADAFALQLLVSPLVWEHHFVLALPVALHAAAVAGRTRPLAVLVGVALMLWMPTADVFLLGHHRLAGLLVLLWVTRDAGLAPGGAADPGEGGGPG